MILFVLGGLFIFSYDNIINFMIVIQIFFGGWMSLNVQIPWKEVEARMFALNVVSCFYLILAHVTIFYYNPMMISLKKKVDRQ